MGGVGCDEDLKSITEKYKAQEQLWNGRFSTLFRIKDEAKVLKIFKGARTQDDVLREKDTLNRIGEHSNIVRLWKSDLESSYYRPRYVMILEYCDGGTLNEYVIKTAGQLKDQQIILFMKDIASGLEHLHSLNLHHGNLHPGNILIKTEGRRYTCVISGFRCCIDERMSDTRRHNNDSDNEDTFFHCFDDPDDRYTRKSDLFSYAVICTALFRRQMKANTLVAYLNDERFAEVEDGQVTEEVMVNHTRNKGTAHILVKLLKKHPDQRPNARDVTTALENIETKPHYSGYDILHLMGIVVALGYGLFRFLK